MTSRIKAINHYHPRVKISKTVDTQALAEYIGEISTFHESEVTAMLKGLSYVMLKFIRKGRSVKIEGLGTFLPNVELSGRVDLQYRAEPVEAGDEMRHPPFIPPSPPHLG